MCIRDSLKTEYQCKYPEIVTRRAIPMGLSDSEFHDELLSMASDVFWMFGWVEAKSALRDVLPRFEEELRRRPH